MQTGSGSKALKMTSSNRPPTRQEYQKWRQAWLDLIFADPKLAAGAKLVAWVIACYFNQREYLDGNGLRAWPSLVTIAKKSGQNKKRVLLAIKELKEAGYIIVEVRYDAKTRRHKSNNY